MNVLYNSEHYHVVEYPAQDAFELIYKPTARSTFLQGSMARNFRDSMQNLIALNESVDSVDEFLDEYPVWATHPCIYH
jgi:Protein of unknown function (DUF3567)